MVTVNAQRITITTENSVYVVEDNTVSRQTAGRAMRRDNEPVPLLALWSVEVGKPAIMLVEVREDRNPTLRTTSPVLSVEHGHG